MRFCKSFNRCISPFNVVCIVFIEQQMSALDKVIQGADVQFDAIRIIVNNP